MARQDANQNLLNTAFLYGANASYIEELQARYEKDPASVDAEWQAFFGALKDDKQAVEKAAEGPSWEKPNWPIHANGVAGEEQMCRVVVDLRTLMGFEGVFDGQLVQPELVCEVVKLLGRRPAEVDPDHRAGPREVFGHLRDREALSVQHAVEVDAGLGAQTCLARGCAMVAT